MAQLETPTEEPDQEDTPMQVVPVVGTDDTLSIPADATPVEAAALAAAVGAHLTDSRRAAAATVSSKDHSDSVDPWVLAARMRSRGKRRWPHPVERGNAWRAAARSF